MLPKVCRRYLGPTLVVRTRVEGMHGPWHLGGCRVPGSKGRPGINGRASRSLYRTSGEPTWQLPTSILKAAIFRNYSTQTWVLMSGVGVMVLGRYRLCLLGMPGA